MFYVEKIEEILDPKYFAYLDLIAESYYSQDKIGYLLIAVERYLEAYNILSVEYDPREAKEEAFRAVIYNFETFGRPKIFN